MKDNICSKNEKNTENRKQNTFLHIADTNANKYMALSRSIDSQLGNRVQRIIFYLAREKYTDICVPNIVHLKHDEKENEMIVTLYSAPIKLPIKCQNKDYNPFQQYIYVDREISDAKFKKLFKIKSDCNKIKTIQIKFSNCSKKILTEYYNNLGKSIPVDLLIFYFNDKDEIDYLNLCEIKLGGNLDTKNAPSNANEVLKNKNLFSFIGNTHSYFATCYGKCSPSVAGAICKNGCELLSPELLWKMILPDTLSYDSFICEYTKAFKKAKVEATIKKL